MTRLTRLLELVGAAAIAVAIAIALTGGGVFTIGMVRVGLRDAMRPAVAGVFALAASEILRRRRRGGGSSQPGPRALALICLVVCLASIAVWLAIRVTTCGGLDSYAYVSAAHFIAGGRLHEPQPIASILPFDGAMRAASPLGYIPSLDGSAIVPEFPLGLPIIMAVFYAALGPGGPFWVSPLFGVIGVVLTFRIARSVAGEATAWLSAVLVAVHPIFVTQAIQPMSDVAATASFLGAIYFLVRQPAVPVIAGAFGALALWIRPPLMLPLALSVLFLPRSEAQELRRTGALERHVLYLTTLGAGIGLLACLQWYLYGHPATSGRGTALHLFEPGRVLGNLVNYAKWFTVLHTPLIYVAIGAALWRGTLLRRFVMVTGVVVAAEVAPYFAYVQHDDWETLRYWLPALPLILIIAAHGVVVLAGSLVRPRLGGTGVPGNAETGGSACGPSDPSTSSGSSRARSRDEDRSGRASASGGGAPRALINADVGTRVSLLVAAMAVTIAGASCLFLKGTATFTLARGEARYAALGEWLRVHTPPDAVVIASTHSGSIRMYGKRVTLRWEEIPPDRLAATARAIRGQGRQCLVAIDATEDFLFRRRFPPEALADLNMFPAGGLKDMAVFSLEPRTAHR